MRVLLAEDDPDVRALVRRGLIRAGFAVDAVRDGAEALWMASEVDYDVIVLDVNMPAPDGFEVCRRLRAAGNWTPLIMMTARNSVLDRIAGLDAGADDYVVKPFSMPELEARLRAVHRRRQHPRPTVLVVGSLEVDVATRTVRFAGEEVALTSKEFALVELLARRPGQIVTRTAIIDALYDFSYEGRSNVVESLVRRVRQKIDRPFGRHSIETVRGAGYRLRVE